MNLSRKPTASDQKKFWDLLYAMPMIERGKPLVKEMFWMLQLHPMTNALPAYCYRILEVFRKTYFKNFPALSDTVAIVDEVAAREAKTLEAAKKVMRIDWVKLGFVVGVATRCVRHAEWEVAAEAGDLGKCAIEETKDICALLFGRQWVEVNSADITAKPLNDLIAEHLNRYLEPFIAQHAETGPKVGLLAYQWGSEAMTGFYKGMAEGMVGFLDESGSLVGESNRAGIYLFMLLVWPEIREMMTLGNNGARARSLTTRCHRSLFEPCLGLITASMACCHVRVATPLSVPAM
jgi:hypothetical protein